MYPYRRFLLQRMRSLRYILDSELGVISSENKDGQDGNKPASDSKLSNASTSGVKAVGVCRKSGLHYIEVK